MVEKAVESIDPALLPLVLSLKDNEVILPLRVKREDVNKVKAVKLSDQEVERVTTFQEYLFDRGYIPENSFAALVVYLFNLGFTLHKQEADREAEEEEARR